MNRNTELKKSAIMSLIDLYAKQKFTGELTFKINFSQGGITDMRKIEDERIRIDGES
jgi:hypothetical protein